ncbi:GD24225, partial [Drosophila simulans]
FLLSRQHEDGSFREDFKYFSRSGSSILFTSSVLLALQKQATPNTVAKNKAYPEFDKLVSQLRSVAKQENDEIWWTEDVQNGSPQDVEITSYALLALMALKADKPESAISTVRWLLAQRNIHGDFESSQKTVVGLTALIEFAEKWGYQLNAWEVSISNEDISERLVACNLLTQTVNFPLDTKRLEEANPSFGIQTTLKSGSLSSKMELVVCVEFVERSTNASNMAVMEVSLPSGYSADKSSFKRIRDVEGVGSVDTKNEDSVVIVYFESLAKNESKCIPVEAYRTLEVTNLKPSIVVIYDNYGRKATEYYQLELELGDFKGT